MAEIDCVSSESAGSNLGPGASCWKVGSYLPMPGGLQCSRYFYLLEMSKSSVLGVDNMCTELKKKLFTKMNLEHFEKFQAPTLKFNKIGELFG